MKLWQYAERTPRLAGVHRDAGKARRENNEELEATELVRRLGVNEALFGRRHRGVKP